MTKGWKARGWKRCVRSQNIKVDIPPALIWKRGFEVIFNTLSNVYDALNTAFDIAYGAYKEAAYIFEPFIEGMAEFVRRWDEVAQDKDSYLNFNTGRVEVW